MDRKILRPALGDDVPIGTLYDARTDRFLNRSLIREGHDRSIISTHALPGHRIEVGYQDTLSEKFKKLKIDFNLGASILSGLVTVGGLGQFIDAQTNDPPDFQAAVYHIFTTVHNRLDLSNPDLRRNLTQPTLDAGEATHVAIDVQYGAQFVISVDRWFRSNDDRGAIETQLRSKVQEFIDSADPQRPRQPDESSDSFEQVAIYGTILENSELILDGLNEARKYVELLPTLMRTTGSGHGTPVAYQLIPLRMLEYFNIPCNIGNEVTLSASYDCLKQIFDVVDKFRTCRLTLRKHDGFISKFKAYLDPNTSFNILERLDHINQTESALKRELGEMITSIRRDRSDPTQLWQLLSKFSKGNLAPENITCIPRINQEKLNFIDKATGSGAVYVGFGSPGLDKFLQEHDKQTAYILYFSSATMQDPISWKSNADLFMRLVQDSRDARTIAVMVDCDATRDTLRKTVIIQLEDGRKVVDDLVEERKYTSQHCYARYQSQYLESDDIKKPLLRRHVKIACPGRNCSNDNIRDWRCFVCDAPLEYGFSDQFVYCDCGRAMYNAFEFKCNHDQHGSEYVQYDQSILLGCLQSLKPSNYLNILILGETGVGKSTFINAFVNYLAFSTLDEALQHDDFFWVIPTSFAIQTMDRSNPGSRIVQNKIQIGKSDGEHDGTTGQSATQRTQVHAITVGSWTYRLIDTPGIGDTRSLNHDKKNMADILATVSGYEHLHGIVILLKSNSARLTVHFAFCIKELLTHLHRNATNNVVWGFTNTRISNYMPGDTYGTLQQLLEEHSHIGLTLTNNSVYCFDSESFRYLAAAKNKIEMENKQDFDSSWQRSREETTRMLNYFMTREPHPVQSTASLNGTRNLIKELTKPMAEISKLIRTNISLREDDVKQLQDARLTGDRLRTKLHPEKTLMRQVPLEKPRTVCSDADCIEYKDDGTGTGTMLVDYPKPCHANCRLTTVTPEVRAHPSLLKCWAFRDQENCRQCGHKWTLHLHFLYELETYQTTIKDLGIEKQLKEHASDLVLKKSAIANRKKLIEEYQKEHHLIQEAAAKFGLFMRDNSILPYNDATLAYLDLLIESEQAKVEAGGGVNHKNALQALQDDKQKHIELVGVLEESMRDRATGRTRAIGQDEVNQIIRQLYSLHHFGENLRKLRTEIAYTHALTNRENPHRVRSRHVGRRNGSQDPPYRSSVSNNPLRSFSSNGSPVWMETSNVVERAPTMYTGLARGSMRNSPPSSQQQLQQLSQQHRAGPTPHTMSGASTGFATTQMLVRSSTGLSDSSTKSKSQWKFNPFKLDN